MKKKDGKYSLGSLGQLTIPLIAIALLVVFNLIRDPGFFSIGISHNSNGNAVLSGTIISIINGASELAILAMGLTLVTDNTKDFIDIPGLSLENWREPGDLNA